MNKRLILALILTCAICLFGCGTAHQEDITQGNVTEHENHFDTMESLPAQESECSNESKEETVDLSEIPGGTRFVVDIWDRTKEEQIACDQVLEKFWEDDVAEYYFECVKSQYIIVMDNTSGTVDLVTALSEELVTMETLDHYGIEYITRPKN